MDVIFLVLLVVVTLAVIGWNGVMIVRLNRCVDGVTAKLTHLTEATGDLAHRLGRLANAVDQSRLQLQRALELSSTIHRMIYSPLYKNDMLSPDEMSTINTYLIELKAIAVVNGDTDFIERVGNLRRAAEFLLTPDPDQHTPSLTVSKATEDVQRKVYALLADATRIN